MRSPAQATHCQVEARRTILALIVAIGCEILDLVFLAGMFQDMRNRLIDLCVAPATLFVSEFSGISDASHYQAMLDTFNLVLIQSQPSDRADRPGNK